MGAWPEAARPFVSVIVPVRDRTRYLAQCLRSVLDQGLPAAALEILVVDNAGPHDLAPLLREIGAGRIAYLKRPRDLGLFASWNDAIGRASGEWIHLLPDDDWLDRGFHAAMAQTAGDAGPEVGVLAGVAINMDERSGRSWSPPPLAPAAGPLGPDFLRRLVMANPLQIAAVLIRRDAFGTVGPFREDLPFTADWEWYMRAALRLDWWYQPSAGARFRLHAESQSRALARTGRTAQDIRRTLDGFADLLPPALAAQLLPAARRRHAELMLRDARALSAAGRGEVAERYLAEARALDPGLVAASLPDPQPPG